MAQRPPVSIAEHFAELSDPRRREGVYPLINVVVIAICAVICGCDDFVSIADKRAAELPLAPPPPKSPPPPEKPLLDEELPPLPPPHEPPEKLPKFQSPNELDRR